MIDNIKEEVRVAVEENNVKSAYFMDLEFLANPKLTEEVCNFLIQKKYPLKWCCQTRVDSLNMTIVKKMKEAGCKLIHFGIESGNQKYLDATKKHLLVNEMKKTIDMCHSFRVKSEKIKS